MHLQALGCAAAQPAEDRGRRWARGGRDPDPGAGHSAGSTPVLTHPAPAWLRAGTPASDSSYSIQRRSRRRAPPAPVLKGPRLQSFSAPGPTCVSLCCPPCSPPAPRWPRGGPHSLSSLYHWKSAGGTAMASQRRRAARPRAVRALVTSVMVGGSGGGRGSADCADQGGGEAGRKGQLRGLAPSPVRSLHPVPGALPPAGEGGSQLTVTSTRRLSGAEFTPLCVTHSYSPAWPRWMPEISRISPSEVKPSVGGRGEGRRGRTQTLNTGQHGHNTDTHQRGGHSMAWRAPGAGGAGWNEDGVGGGGLGLGGPGNQVGVMTQLW